MIHNPELNNKHLEIIQRELGGEYEDSSWKNDATDSIYADIHDVKIYLPNAEVADPNDHESFDTFSVVINSCELDGETEYSKPMKTVEEVIEFIKSY